MLQHFVVPSCLVEDNKKVHGDVQLLGRWRQGSSVGRNGIL